MTDEITENTLIEIIDKLFVDDLPPRPPKSVTAEEMAEIWHITESAAYNRLKRMETDGKIKSQCVRAASRGSARRRRVWTLALEEE